MAKKYGSQNVHYVKGENTIPAALPGIQLTGGFTWLILSTLHPILAKERGLPVYVDQYNLHVMLQYYLLVLFMIS